MKPPDWTADEEEALRTRWRGAGRQAKALALALAQEGFPARTPDALKAKANRLGLETKAAQGWIQFARWCRAHQVGDRLPELRRAAQERGLLKTIDSRLYLRPVNEDALRQAWLQVKRGGLTAKAVGRRLGVGFRQVRFLAKKGLLRATRISPRDIRFEAADVATLLSAQAKYRNLLRSGEMLSSAAIAQKVGIPVRLVQEALKRGQLKGERLWWPGLSGPPRWFVRKAIVEAWIAAGAPTSAEGLMPHWISGGKERRDAKAKA